VPALVHADAVQGVPADVVAWDAGGSSGQDRNQVQGHNPVLRPEPVHIPGQDRNQVQGHMGHNHRVCCSCSRGLRLRHTCSYRHSSLCQHQPCR
jgi:hypothetical protein